MTRVSFVTKSEDGIIRIPKKFKKFNAKRLRVQIELDELEKKKNKVITVKGALSRFKNTDLIKFEKNAWSKAIKEKYENS
jgi:hypothetical protein